VFAMLVEKELTLSQFSCKQK